MFYFWLLKDIIKFFSHFFFSTLNCGGNGTTFLYYPQESLTPCVPYEWEVTVFISDGENTVSTTISLCDVEILAAPSGYFIFMDCLWAFFIEKPNLTKNNQCNLGGECVINYDTDGCGTPFDEIEVQCTDWTIPCGETNQITMNILKRSQVYQHNC